MGIANKDEICIYKHLRLQYSEKGAQEALCFFCRELAKESLAQKNDLIEVICL